ncbi:MAG: hypothetical protein Q8O55_07650 [Dehalococcoidales bacterium]|nr:hypothetical protein [Dehalococcoidales bacterium]
MESPTKEDVVRIAKEIAKEVIKVVREEHLKFHEPASIEQGLQESMSEELTASAWYQLRAKSAAEHGDHKTANLYNHIASEEARHYKEFNKRLTEVAVVNIEASYAINSRRN